MNVDYILELKDIKKEFSGVEVLHGINLSVQRGEIHALVGENGAGKSTLMKVVSGFYPYGSYGGELLIDSQRVYFSNIRDAEHAGVEIISQEIELVLQLKVYENVFLGDELSRHGLIDKKQMIRKTEKILGHFGLNIRPDAKLEELGVGQRQMIAIAKALKKNARILILDEPTASLSDAEANRLFDMMKELKRSGVTSIYISHRLNEIMKLSDTITILRDGHTVLSDRKENFDENQIITSMVGREMHDRYPKTRRVIGDVAFSLRGITVVNDAGKKIIDNVSLDLHAGEVVGMAGLVGAGRTELAQCVFGAMPVKRNGGIYVSGKEVSIKNCADALKCGIGLVTEDRKHDGLVACLDISNNMIMANLKALSKYGLIDSKRTAENVLEYVNRLSIHASSLTLEVDRLSGGNQQKVSIAKILMIKPKVLILDEPTRGIDVGAKYEIYAIINQLANEGVAILMISSDLPEVIGISDRIMVMKEGKITGEILGEAATPERIMFYATLEENKYEK
jgi:D-xylose transport system ATP-binding protein